MPKRVDHAVRRDGIIDAARAIIMERGIDRTTVRLIAQRAGFTTGALVHYFGGKSELIRQALERYVEDYDDLSVAVDRLRDPSDPVLDWDEVKRELLATD